MSYSRNVRSPKAARERVLKELKKRIKENYERPSCSHWSGSHMAALKAAFDRLEKDVEEEFKIAFNLATPSSYDELEAHRSYLREKWNESYEFFRTCWKDRYETPSDLSYWRTRAELAEAVIRETEAPEVPKDHAQAKAEKAWMDWKDKGK